MSGRAATDWRRVDRKNVALVNDGRVVTELFWGAVVVEEAVAFPFHVVQLGIYVSAELAMETKLVGQKLETPTRVDVAIEGPDAAVLAVNQGLRALLESGDAVVSRAGISFFHNVGDLPARLRVIVGVKMPRVHVRVAMSVVFKVIPGNHAHVFHQSGRIQRLCQLPH